MSNQLRRFAELATPAAVQTALNASAYRRSHALPVSGSALLRAYSHARQFGLHLLPPGLSLDGLVVDIGANVGEFTSAVRRLDPRGRVLAVEPAPEPRAALERRFAGDPAVTIDASALSDARGTSTFNVSASTVFSSLLPMRPEVAELYSPADTEIVSTPTVDVATLDDLVKEPVRLLKVDTQGHDLRVLNGGQETLARTDAVLLELALVHHYEHDSTFFELHPRMLELGFVLRDVGPAHVEQGRALWMDGCYVRAGS
jgi:FkbM family methyltransferase